MIKITDELAMELSQYANPYTKIARLEKEGKLFKIKRGFYETDKNTNPFYLANVIYGPSYISFQTALSYYNMIPERVYQITCATINKHKRKELKTMFGTYTYKDIPSNAYPLDVIRIEENGYCYLIASREKALCDMIYEYAPVNSIKEIKQLIFEDLRIDEDVFYSLDMQDLCFIASLYKTKNHKLLIKMIRKIK